MGDFSSLSALRASRQDLRRKGQMPRRGDAVPEFSAKPGTDGGPAGGFVDIDEALMEDVEDLEEPLGGFSKRRCGASRRFQASKKSI